MSSIISQETLKFFPFFLVVRLGPWPHQIRFPPKELRLTAWHSRARRIRSRASAPWMRWQFRWSGASGCERSELWGAMDIIICIFFALEAGDLINSFTLLTIFFDLACSWTSTLIYDCLSRQVALRLTAHGFKFFYMFPGSHIRHVNDASMFSCLLPWLCNCSFWDFAATKVRLGMECLKLSVGAAIVDYLDQRAGVESEGETAMTTGLRFLPGPRADSRRSSDRGKQWTLWR